MLNLQTGLKYRQKIEQKLSLTARQPKGDLCDLDSLEEEVFEDKNTTEIANEVMSNLGTGGEKKKKEKRTKKKRPTANGNKRSGVMFNEILGDSDDN
jgi:ribosome biogenesis protein BRX1